MPRVALTILLLIPIIAGCSYGKPRTFAAKPPAVTAEYPVQELGSLNALIAVGEHLWATGPGGVISISLKGEKHVYKVSENPDFQPQGIAFGPKGSLWIALTSSGYRPGTDEIVQMTLDGRVLKRYALPTSDVEISGITVGADGALWFTESSKNAIGRMTSAGKFAEIKLRRAGIRSRFPYAGLDSIASSPDGSIWFTEFIDDKVGEITPNRTVVEFSLPRGSGPLSLAVSPSNEIWFTELKANKIGQITSTKQLKEFKVAEPSAGLRGIFVSPSRDVWYTEGRANRINYITTKSASGSFPSVGRAPSELAIGADGNVWFTALASDSGAGHWEAVYRLSLR